MILLRLFCCRLYDTDTHMYPCGLLINKDDGLYVLAMSINAVVFVDICNSFLCIYPGIWLDFLN